MSTGDIYNILENYDLLNNEWPKGANLPTQIGTYGLTSIEGKLYLIGGWDGQRYLNNVYQYDLETASWQSISIMPSSRSNLGVAIEGRDIFLLGGINANEVTSVNEVFISDAV